MKHGGYFAWAALLLASWICDTFADYNDALTCAVGAVVVGVLMVKRYTR